ncbi:hypothetical protein QNI19_06520 [Cytophagaceae bacterium DM2B3-1]|uniref:Cytochrome oxidase subunit I profile domain-containing protein n=1 Tax=Xanthocytophaga flava TaxID=3048013 RepID=A0ABT7CFX8_9BACT|nr:hypothetical protein [Xanthocytophaga flavus]MDJ1466580.1 hypothetical protein [Xanthocytophaga flavus]MDJ1492578.1 hypothetical protein [Xanthocytophaga flavus]
MIQRYFTAYIWLGIISVLTGILVNIGLYWNGSPEQFVFIRTDFLNTTILFFTPYLVGVLWLWYIQPMVDIGRQKSFRIIWRVCYSLLVLFWGCKIILLFYPIKYDNGWTVYPPLHGLLSNLGFARSSALSRLEIEVLSMFLLAISMGLQLINLMRTIFIRWKKDRLNSIKWISYLLLFLAFPTFIVIVFLSVGFIFLLFALIFKTSFSLSDIYIVNQPENSSNTSIGFWSYMTESIFKYIPYIIIWIITLVCLYSEKRYSKKSVIFAISAIVVLGMDCVLKYLYITLSFKSDYGWQFLVFFGLIAILYQMISLNRQRVKKSFVYWHLGIFFLGAVYIVSVSIPVMTDGIFWNLERIRMLYVYLLFLIGEVLFICNYYFSNSYTKKAPA